MDEKKDNWERLQNLSDDYEYDPSIAQRAIETIEQQKKEKATKKDWFLKRWKPMAISLATCVAVLAVAIPVYHSLFSSHIEDPSASQSSSSSDLGPGDSSSSSSNVYYEENQLTVNPVEDVKAYVQEQALNFKFFDYSNTINYSAVVTDTNEFAYLKQEMLYIGADGFDQIKSWSVVLTEAEFNFEKSYEENNQIFTVNGISVNYKMTEEIGAGKKDIWAKFTYEDVEYYLELTTAGETEAKIEQFVTMLIG